MGGPPTDLDEANLLEAWRGGDNAAGHALFQRYFPIIQRFFANKVAGEHEAEELIQRTFLACVEAKERFSGQSSFRGYLLGIARYTLFGHYRTAANRPDGPDPAEASVRDLGAGPSTLLGKGEQHHLLLETLRSIPLESQIILELYYWEGMTGPELGEFMGVPENTARSRLRKAKQLLVEQLRATPSTFGRNADEGDLDRWASEVRSVAFAMP